MLLMPLIQLTQMLKVRMQMAEPGPANQVQGPVEQNQAQGLAIQNPVWGPADQNQGQVPAGQVPAQGPGRLFKMYLSNHYNNWSLCNWPLLAL